MNWYSATSFEPGQYATRRMLQLCKGSVAEAIKYQIGFTLMQADIGNPIIVINKKIRSAKLPSSHNVDIIMVTWTKHACSHT